MNFYPYSPIAIPRTTKGLIANDSESLRLFWSGVEAIEEGLSNAIGIYIFSIRAGGGIIPWYVGKAEKQSFSKECFNTISLLTTTMLLLDVVAHQCSHLYPG